RLPSGHGRRAVWPPRRQAVPAALRTALRLPALPPAELPKLSREPQVRPPGPCPRRPPSANGRRSSGTPDSRQSSFDLPSGRKSMSIQERTGPDCAYPKELLPFLYRGKGRSRRLRLFAAACCRQVWDMLEPQPFRAAVEVAERYADRRARKKDLVAAWVAVAE